MTTISLAPSLHQRLHKESTKSLVKELISRKLLNWEYSPEDASNQAKELADEVLSKLEQKDRCNRYKYTVQVWISNQKDGGLHLASRQLWDPTTDSSLTVTHSTPSFICLVNITVTFVY